MANEISNAAWGFTEAEDIEEDGAPGSKITVTTQFMLEIGADGDGNVGVYSGLELREMHSRKLTQIFKQYLDEVRGGLKVWQKALAECQEMIEERLDPEQLKKKRAPGGETGCPDEKTNNKDKVIWEKQSRKSRQKITSAPS